MKAIVARKARWFLAHAFVPFTRQLLNHAEIVSKHTLKKIASKDIIIRPNSLIDVRCIDIYNEITLDKVPVKERKGHWVHTFYDLPEMQKYIEGQFRDPEKVQKSIDCMNSL